MVLGVVPVRVVLPSAVVRRWARLVVHASVRRSLGAPAQPAHAADRFAHEIVGFLTVSVMRSRRLMGNPLGGCHQAHGILQVDFGCYTYREGTALTSNAHYANGLITRVSTHGFPA